MKGGSWRLVLRLLVAVMLVCGNVVGSAFGSNGGSDGGNSLKGKSNNGLVVVVPSSIATYKAPPDTITVPMVIASEKGKAHIKEIRVLFEGVESKVMPNKDLEAAGLGLTGLIDVLEDKDRKAQNEVFKKVLYVEAELDVSSLQLKEGTQGNISISVLGTTDEGSTEATVTADYQALALPSTPYWYAGDCHVHTSWSDVWFVPISKRASYAKNNGYKFIVITDHEDMIDPDWPDYVADCNNNQSSYGLPVMPGAEIAEINDSGHTLGYRLKESATSIPHNQTLSPQSLINAINNHNSPYSYAVIAHPYNSSHPWPNWSVTGFRAMELLSQEYVASSYTINKWFELLRNGLSSTISTGKFVVGIGSTDCHNLQDPAEKGMSWVYTTSYSSSNRTAIWDAISKGRVSASGRNDFGCFTLNNAQQGSKISTTAGSSLTFNITQKPVTGRRCASITIYDKNKTAIKTFSYPSTTTVSWTTTAPGTDTFYVVKFYFENTDRTNPGDVWANPVFVDVR